jgi:FkbM family methyltransferase
MLENVIPRVLGWVPIGLRRALIGHPDNPSRLANLAHNLLNRVSPAESQVFACRGVLEGYRMSIDWSRYRSFVYGTWEPKVVRAITDIVKPGMTVIDIGAHIGYYTLLFAKCVGPGGRVFAFEPFPGNFALLQRNINLNNLKNVQLMREAIFSRTQQMTISAPEDEPNPGSGSMHEEAGQRQYQVEAITLDDFCDRLALQPDVVKMDIEGAEYDALLGARKAIGLCRPKLLIELHHFDGNVGAAPAPKLLTEWGYQVKWVENWELTSYILALPGTN